VPSFSFLSLFRPFSPDSSRRHSPSQSPPSRTCARLHATGPRRHRRASSTARAAPSMRCHCHPRVPPLCTAAALRPRRSAPPPPPPPPHADVHLRAAFHSVLALCLPRTALAVASHTPQPPPHRAREVFDRLPDRDGSREEEGKGGCGREARPQADSCREREAKRAEMVAKATEE